MNSKTLLIFTRTPLHIGAGSSIGAIDQPIQRERHTSFPIIPGSSLKGVFANQWLPTLRNQKNEITRITTKEEDRNGQKITVAESCTDAAWLFGSDNTEFSFAGALLFSEARLLAFPIRSAKGSFAWITCPLILQRAKRDGVLACNIPPEPGDNHAIFKADSPLSLGETTKQIVLEEYCFTQSSEISADLTQEISSLISDELFTTCQDRLVIVSNGMMSHFVSTACEVAQHVTIDDETGTASDGKLFNQELVPSETLFYSLLHATDRKISRAHIEKSADEALSSFTEKLTSNENLFQFGGDASTGLGFCTVTTN